MCLNRGCIPTKALLRTVELATLARKAENVGERFPEEARRIHYDEVPANVAAEVKEKLA